MTACTNTAVCRYARQRRRRRRIIGRWWCNYCFPRGLAVPICAALQPPICPICMPRHRNQISPTPAEQTRSPECRRQATIIVVPPPHQLPQHYLVPPIFLSILWSFASFCSITKNRQQDTAPAQALFQVILITHTSPATWKNYWFLCNFCNLSTCYKTFISSSTYFTSLWKIYPQIMCHPHHFFGFQLAFSVSIYNDNVSSDI